MSLTRREFIVGCSAAIASMGGGRLGNMVFANPSSLNNPAVTDTGELFVMVFLRGGCDGLSLVSPYDDTIYVQKRGSLVVQNPLTLTPKNDTFKSSIGLHPNATALKDLYDGGNLAIVHACGLNDETRSHFDAMDYIERGTPGNKGTASGWLTRHIQTVNPDGALPTLAGGAAAPSSLLGNASAVAMNAIGSYDLSGPYRYTRNPDDQFHNAMLNTLEQCYAGSSNLQKTGQRTIETIKTLQSETAPNTSITYPGGGFGDTLKLIAQVTKLDLGLRVATVDLGGWDHHEAEGVNEGYGPFFNLAKTLSDGLAAFYNDLSAYQNKLTVVVQSEFGRRLGANKSGGTDHGHGGVMLVMGGNVNGGKMYGTWPGLEELDQNEDLMVKTDYRTVLSEAIVRRLGNPKLGTVFPGIDEQIYSTDKALGLFRGADQQIDYTTPIFNDNPNLTEHVFLPMTMR